MVDGWVWGKSGTYRLQGLISGGRRSWRFDFWLTSEGEAGGAGTLGFSWRPRTWRLSCLAEELANHLLFYTLCSHNLCLRDLLRSCRMGGFGGRVELVACRVQLMRVWSSIPTGDKWSWGRWGKGPGYWLGAWGLETVLSSWGAGHSPLGLFCCPRNFLKLTISEPLSY